MRVSWLRIYVYSMRENRAFAPMPSIHACGVILAGATYNLYFTVTYQCHERARSQEHRTCPAPVKHRRRRKASSRPFRTFAERFRAGNGPSGTERPVWCTTQATQVADPGILLKFHTRRARGKGDRFSNRLLRPHILYTSLYTRCTYTTTCTRASELAP